MKAVKYLLVLLVAFLVLPFHVLAEGEETVDAAPVDNRVHVYLFRGEGCPHCQEAEEWFDSIQGEYGDYFEVIDYETWYNSENQELMKKVAEYRKETADGVPYIIIGNMSWSGFAADYEEEMLSQIKDEYAKDVSERYDVIKLVSGEQTEEKDSGSDVLALILILIVTGGICFGVYKAREANKK